MSASLQRHVRHMRLSAGSEADVRHALPLLEDALRCATLPDDGARLCIVRKLALGRIARGMSSQSLSRIIEQRVAALGGAWVAGGSAAAAQANFVDFPSALEARMQLASRLTKDDDCAGWYWPLAVPEFRVTESVRSSLRNMAAALAQWPEARVALPTWCARLVDAGATPQLAAALTDAEAGSLLAHAGIALLPEDASISRELGAPAQGRTIGRDAQAAELLAQGRGGSGYAIEMAESAALSSQPRWLRSLLFASKLPRFRYLQPVHAGTSALHMSVATGATSNSLPANALLAPLQAARSQTSGMRAKRAGKETALNRVDEHIASSSSTEGMLADELEQGAQREAKHSPSATSEVPADQPAWLASTSHAGLFFLLPVLMRLGVVDWAECAGHDVGEFASRVLLIALRRLRAEIDEPLYALLGDMAGAHIATIQPIPAPASWEDNLLRSPKMPSAFMSLARQLAATSDTDAQTLIWLHAARRWLRRAGGIGLASLVRRPGRLAATSTHIDLYFSLGAIDLRVRRIGLDIDPGWLPWFGRVISYHYVRGIE